jgi:type IV pilus biogenesis protein PilP
MELPKNLKSKKLVLVGAGLIVVILVGFFVLKFMTSGGADAVPEKPRSAPRTAKKMSKPKKQEQPEKSPLFRAMEALKDPFRADDPRAAELQDKLSLTQKEVEYLRAILEEKKLRQQIKEIEMSIAKADRTASPGSEVRVLSPEGKQSQPKAKEKRLVVKAIMITDEEESALVVSGNRKSWVHQGEYFDGWEVKEIRGQSVVFRKGGKTFVFFYDRPAISREGEP